MSKSVVRLGFVSALIWMCAALLPAVAADAGPGPTHPVDNLRSSLRVELGPKVVLELVLVKPGEFDMGSPTTEPDRKADEVLHHVRITKPYYISKYELTQAQWMAVMQGYNPSGHQSPKFPVTMVSWNDAQMFLMRANELAGAKLPAGMKLRLPTEAEWEYACRAGTTSLYYFGNKKTDIPRHAWFVDNISTQKPINEVGGKKSNAWGLYDLCGNVSEWCSDWYGGYPSSAVEDPTGPTNGTWRVVRGGSIIHDAADFRSARRLRRDAGYAADYIGFRVAAGFEEPAVETPAAPAAPTRPLISIVTPVPTNAIATNAVPTNSVSKASAASAKPAQPASNGAK